MDNNKLLNIRAIVADCEDVQNSNDSQYAKDKEKEFAYDKIRDVILGSQEADCERCKNSEWDRREWGTENE